ncbi:MAG: hypothetical protein EPO06_11890 [Burkholderiaceae bacterium]|nr:MAG: hypothetical protein EPO06_11890 [Burkholderiaceae bacterium]
MAENNATNVNARRARKVSAPQARLLADLADLGGTDVQRADMHRQHQVNTWVAVEVAGLVSAARGETGHGVPSHYSLTDAGWETAALSGVVRPSAEVLAALATLQHPCTVTETGRAHDVTCAGCGWGAKGLALRSVAGVMGSIHRRVAIDAATIPTPARDVQVGALVLVSRRSNDHLTTYDLVPGQTPPVVRVVQVLDVVWGGPAVPDVHIYTHVGLLIVKPDAAVLVMRGCGATGEDWAQAYERAAEQLPHARDWAAMLRAYADAHRADAAVAAAIALPPAEVLDANGQPIRPGDSVIAAMPMLNGRGYHDPRLVEVTAVDPAKQTVTVGAGDDDHDEREVHALDVTRLDDTGDAPNSPTDAAAAMLRELGRYGPVTFADNHPAAKTLRALIDAGVVVRGPMRKQAGGRGDHWYWLRGGRPGVDVTEDAALLLARACDTQTPGMVDAMGHALAEVLRQSTMPLGRLLDLALELAARDWASVHPTVVDPQGPARAAATVAGGLLAVTEPGPHTVVEVVTDPAGVAAACRADGAYAAATSIRARGVGVFPMAGNPQFARRADAVEAAQEASQPPGVRRVWLVVPAVDPLTGRAPAGPFYRTGGVLVPAQRQGGTS